MRITQPVGAALRLVAFAALALTVLPAGLSAQGVAIKAKRIVTGAGPDIVDGVLLVENGKIKALGRDLRIPKGWKIVDHGKEVLVPGMIDLGSRAAAPNDLSESSEAIDPRACTIEAVALEHRDYALLRSHGITSIGILPDGKNVISGQGCVLKTSKDAKGRAVVERGPIMMTLDALAFSRTRTPSSYIGVRNLLGRTMKAAKEGKGDPALVACAKGKRLGVVYANTEAALYDALKMKREFDLDLTIMGATGLRRIVSRFKDSGQRVALSALTFASPKAVATLPALLEKNGLEVLFYATTPKRSAAELRLGAALAARSGLGRRAALASITRLPAEALGVAGRVGTLTVGKDADFVVMSGDPLNISTRVIETWIDGSRAYRAASSSKVKELAP